MDLRGDSNLHASALLPVTRRVAPACTLPAAPSTQAEGLPSSRIFRLCRRRTFEAIRRWRRRLHRTMLRPAQPGDEFSSSLESSIPCSAGGETPGCPETSLLQLRLRWVFEFPRILHPSAFPLGRSSSCPEFRALRLRLRCVIGSPRILHLPAGPPVSFRLPRILSPLAAPNG